MGMPRSVVVRILATLERAGFVERVAGNSRLFRVGLGACEFGALYLVGNPLLRSAEDVLHDLAERTGFTAYLGTLNGAEVVIQTLREGRTPVRFIWQAGDRLPVATTALGKAMLMHLDRLQIDAILGVGPVAGLTAGSIRTRAELDAKLALYAPKGWIPASEESFPGVFAVGAAVLDPNGAPITAPRSDAGRSRATRATGYSRIRSAPPDARSSMGSVGRHKSSPILAIAIC